MKLYYVSVTFQYTKKKKYEKFRGPFEHEAPNARLVRPLLNPLLIL